MKLKKSWLYAAGIVAVAAVVAFFMAGKPKVTNENVIDINLAEHKDLAMHIHPKVAITILGKDYSIPPNIGISEGRMRVIHTHEGDGTLHIESPIPHQFYLEDFFTIWGKRFTDTCIFEHCIDGSHTLKAYVNGEESSLYGLIPLYDHDNIRIVYAEKGAGP